MDDRRLTGPAGETPGEICFHAACPGCDDESGPCASSELAERWFLAHVRHHHPDRLDDARRAVLAGAGQPLVDVHEHLGRLTVTCRRCGERAMYAADDAGRVEVNAWLRLHALRYDRPLDGSTFPPPP